jgi:F-type H+-transporting ATPase subunit b
VLIDWFTVAAQALNFLILVWLMKRVLYKPIIAAIDAREKLVAGELADASLKKDVAGKALTDFKLKNEVFDRDRAALLSKATDEAKAQGAHLLDLARASADALQSTRRDALQREAEGFSQLLGKRAQQVFFTLARRALKDLADGSLEAQIAACFCGKLRAIKDEDKTKFIAAIEATAGALSVRSAFVLPPRQQGDLQNALDDVFQRQIAVTYEVAPDLIGGIELTARGQRIAWSIADYLVEFEREVGVSSGVALAPAS